MEKENFLEIVKSIKNAVVANGIEVNILSHVMWDVCKKEYKFYIDDNAPFYYQMPNGEWCGNYNPSFNLQNFMSTSDEDLVEEFIEELNSHKEELNIMISHYNTLKK